MNRAHCSHLPILVWCASALIASAAAQAQPQMSPDEMAWRMFIDAMRPSGQSGVFSKLNWQTWIEQRCLYQPEQTPGCTAITGKPATQRFHGSALAQVKGRSNGGTPPDIEGCNAAQKTHRMICEEVRLNPSAAGFVREHKLQNRPRQASFAGTGDLQFPASAVETKVNWIRYTGSCASYQGQLQGVYTEELAQENGTYCYALAGIHLSSKALPNWLWATFEPQNSFTNPRRCLVLGCLDSFGSNPARNPPGKPFPTKITPALQKLMQDAKLDPVFLNYRMDGAQVDFLDVKGKPVLLGNSIIEAENAGVPLKQASCITCHSVSSIAVNGTDGIQVLGALGNPIGAEPALPSMYQRRDFAWSLFLALPPGPKKSESANLR